MNSLCTATREQSPVTVARKPMHSNHDPALPKINGRKTFKLKKRKIVKVEAKHYAKHNKNTKQNTLSVNEMINRVKISFLKTNKIDELLVRSEKTICMAEINTPL